MICIKCGRELPDNAQYCKACGTQLVRRPRVKSAGIREVLDGEVKLGSKACKAWQLLAGLGAVCSLLIAGMLLFNPILDVLDFDTPAIVRPDNYNPENDAELIDSVSGVIIQCSVAMPELESCTEKAYSDGSWQKDCLTTNNINMRFIRRPAEENWLNTHIYHFYPDVTNVEQFSEAITVSGYTSTRIQFTSDNAPDNVIQAVCVSDGSFDYLFIAELPLVMYDEYSIFADEWFRRLELVDSQTGIESLNPALNVSQSDVLTATE